MAINLDDLDRVDKLQSSELDNKKKKLEGYENKLVGLFTTIQETKSSIAKIQKDIAERKTVELEQKYDDFKELSEEYFSIKNMLFCFPDRIQRQKEHISGLEDVVNNLEQELKIIESSLFIIVNEAVNDNGKKLYTNQAARDAAMEEEKRNSSEYQEMLESLKYASGDLEQAKFNLDRIYNEFKSYQKVADMMSARMNMLS